MTEKEINLFGILTYLIDFLKKNKVIYLIAMLISIIIIFWFSVTVKPQYECHMIANSDIISNYRIKEITDQINPIIQNRNYQSITEIFQIDTIKAKGLKDLAVSVIEDHPDYFDLSKPQFEANCFDVNIVVSNPEFINEYQSGFIKFIENNEFVQNNQKKQQMLIKEAISDMERDIRILSKSGAVNGKGEGIQIITDESTAADNLIVASDSPYYLRRDILSYKKKLSNNEAVNLISPFFCRSKIKSQILVFSVKLIFAIMLLATLIGLMRKRESI